MALNPMEQLEAWLTEHGLNFWREEFYDGFELHLFEDPDMEMYTIRFGRGGDPYGAGIENRYDPGE